MKCRNRVKQLQEEYDRMVNEKIRGNMDLKAGVVREISGEKNVRMVLLRHNDNRIEVTKYMLDGSSIRTMRVPPENIVWGEKEIRILDKDPVDMASIDRYMLEQLDEDDPMDKAVIDRVKRAEDIIQENEGVELSEVSVVWPW